LHRLIDELPESELAAAERFLHSLRATADPVLRARLEAPLAEEPETEEERRAVQGYIAAWRARFRQDGCYPTHWARCCDGVNGVMLEVFVTDVRGQVLAAYERDAR